MWKEWRKQHQQSAKNYVYTMLSTLNVRETITREMFKERTAPWMISNANAQIDILNLKNGTASTKRWRWRKKFVSKMCIFPFYNSRDFFFSFFFINNIRMKSIDWSIRHDPLSRKCWCVKSGSIRQCCDIVRSHTIWSRSLFHLCNEINGKFTLIWPNIAIGIRWMCCSLNIH